MATYIVKRKQYDVIKDIDETTFIASNNGEKFLLKVFAPKSKSFSDFGYAYKKLNNTGVRTPKMFAKDKKQGIYVLEFIDGKTIFETLLENDLEEIIFEQVFIMHAHAKSSKLALYFNPQNFIYDNEKLYYMPFTFDIYKKENDFTQNDIYLWFYSTQFKQYLISQGLPVNNKRMISDFDRNKQIVLTVVKYYQ